MLVAVIVQNARRKYGYADVFPTAPTRTTHMVTGAKKSKPSPASMKFAMAKTRKTRGGQLTTCTRRTPSHISQATQTLRRRIALFSQVKTKVRATDYECLCQQPSFQVDDKVAKPSMCVPEPTCPRTAFIRHIADGLVIPVYNGYLF